MRLLALAAAIALRLLLCTAAELRWHFAFALRLLLGFWSLWPRLQ